MHLDRRPTAWRLTIVDDGSGFDVDAAWGRGLGLISMAERLEAIGGTLEIRLAARTPGRAWQAGASPCRTGRRRNVSA